tara:strand:+ start:252 stop:425 length:174 start_codon:yes stop_codon:yes gene_type:complete
LALFNKDINDVVSIINVTIYGTKKVKNSSLVTVLSSLKKGSSIKKKSKNLITLPGKK